MIGSLLLTAFVTGAGIVATYSFDRRAPGYARVATGMIVGLTTLAFVALALALVIGLGPLTLVLAAAATALLGSGLLRHEARRALRNDLSAWTAGLRGRDWRPSRGALVRSLYVLALAIGLWMVADRNLFQTSDGLYITNVGNLGDLPFHTAITASFAYGNNFPPENPAASGIAFSYYYIVDFIASMFVVAGTTLRDGMLLVTLLGGGCLLAVVHRWAHDITGNPAVARLAPLLLVFSGGLGWFKLIEEAQAKGNGLVGAFQHSDIRFTMEPDGLLRFQNAVTGFLVPQRGILFGMAIAVIVFTLMWQQLTADAGEATTEGGRRQRPWFFDPRMTAAGLLTGLLPMVHIHTFGVVLGTGFLLAVAFQQWRADRWRAWAAYLLAAAVVAVPLVAWTARGNASAISSYFGVQLGWELGNHDFLIFWLVNAGLFIPLLVVAFLWRGAKPLLPNRLVLYVLPFMAWFVVANVFKLAPWPWDNIKVLAYWWLGGTLVVGVLLVALWHRGAAARLVAVALAIVLMAAGALDVARSTIGPSVYQLWSSEGIAFADAVRDRTPADAVILTDPTYNTPILLTGRKLFMGYDGWLFAHGLPYAEREQEAKAMFAGGSQAMDLLREMHVGFIEVGPQERSDVSPNDAFLSQFPVAVEVGEYRLYEVSGL